MTGLLAGHPDRLESARALLEAEWGPVALASAPRPWTESSYYEPEMGPGLMRQFLGFEQPAGVDQLASLKSRAIALEARLAAGAPVPRPVNIDPGFVDANNLTLASTKRAGHRVWIGGGIWAEITLLFRSGAFQPLPWTYPDFRRPESLEWLAAFRKLSLPRL
ncbi:MAG: DUF4416 family protein [Planctomycetes bacterium]|nr:DUF4416 family protein [Planctomycetota bacterium]